MWPFTPTAAPPTTQQRQPPAHRPPQDLARDGTLPGGPYLPPTGGIVGWLRSLWGGWTGAAFSRGTPAEQGLVVEKVRSGPEGVILPWFPPYFQNCTQETLEHRAAYRRMFGDCNVKPALCGTIFGVASLDVNILPASKSHADGQAADFCSWALTERLVGGFPELVWSILSGGLIDGYSLSEKVFAPQDQGEWANKIVLDAVKPLDVDHDVVPQTDDHRNVVSIKGLRYNGGLEFDPRGFVYYRHMPLYGAPTGTSSLRAAYRPWWLLYAAETWRGVALEKRAVPMLLGHYQTSSQKPGLETALAQAKAQTWLSVPEGVQVEALNIAGSSETIFKSACDSWKHDIFLAIQGAFLQSLEGSTQDGRGSSKVHKSTADLIVWYLSSQIEVVINALIRDLVDLNFAVGSYPRARISSVDSEVLNSEIGVVKNLNSIGLDLSKADIYDLAGRQPPNPDDPTDKLPGAPPKPPGPGFPQQMDETENTMTPAAGVAGARPFRFSEEWQRWLRN